MWEQRFGIFCFSWKAWKAYECENVLVSEGWERSGEGGEAGEIVMIRDVVVLVG